MADSPEITRLKYIRDLKIAEIAQAEKDLAEITNKIAAEETGFSVGNVLKVYDITFKVNGFTYNGAYWIIHGNRIRKDGQLGRKCSYSTYAKFTKVS